MFFYKTGCALNINDADKVDIEIDKTTNTINGAATISLLKPSRTTCKESSTNTTLSLTGCPAVNIIYLCLTVTNYKILDQVWQCHLFCYMNLWMLAVTSTRSAITDHCCRRCLKLTCCHIIRRHISAILNHTLCTHSCWWMSCLISFVWSSSSCEQREISVKIKMKIYAAAGNRSSDHRDSLRYAVKTLRLFLCYYQ